MIKLLTITLLIFVGCNHQESSIITIPKTLYDSDGKKTRFKMGMTISECLQIIKKDESEVKAYMDYAMKEENLKHLNLFYIKSEEDKCFLYFNFYRKLIDAAFIVE